MNHNYLGGVGITIHKKGMSVMEWLWMEEFCFLSLKPHARASVGDTCIWWNEV